MTALVPLGMKRPDMVRPRLSVISAGCNGDCRMLASYGMPSGLMMMDLVQVTGTNAKSESTLHNNNNFISYLCNVFNCHAMD